MGKKYELVNESGSELFRIRALRRFVGARGVIDLGELGGYVQGEHNLSHEGTCWISQGIAGENAKVMEDAFIDGPGVRAMGDAIIKGLAVVRGAVYIQGFAVVRGKAFVGGSAIISGSAIIEGSSRVIHSAIVTGSAIVRDDTIIEGNSRIRGTSIIEGNCRVNGHRLINSGRWRTAPPYALVNGYEIRAVSPTMINIGCQTHTEKWWRNGKNTRKLLSTERHIPFFEMGEIIRAFDYVASELRMRRR